MSKGIVRVRARRSTRQWRGNTLPQRPSALDDARRPAIRETAFPVDRTRHHVRPHRRCHRLRKESGDLVCGHRARRRLEDDEQRRDLHADLRGQRADVDRRRHCVADRIPTSLWVGTGESNNRQSTSWGSGVWKTTDGGKTFQNMGLEDSKHINRILIDPTNDDVVLVAATGPLFGPGGERGVFKTIDGGKTWKRVLFVDDETGANDLAMAPSDPKTHLRVDVSAAANGVLHERRRTGQRNLEIDRRRRHVDATAERIPAGPLGRIAVDVYRKNPSILYA